MTRSTSHAESFAASAHAVLLAADEIEIAVLVAIAQIAGVNQPVVMLAVASALREISLGSEARHLRLDHDLAGLALTHRPAVIVEMRTSKGGIAQPIEPVLLVRLAVTKLVISVRP